MRVGIIQSNYMPWRGYFDFIDDCDVFVFYDDVQYTHKDWRNRNRIKTNMGGLWLTVPVIHDRSTLIEQAQIDYNRDWVSKHIRSITLNYRKAPHFDHYADEFFDILRSRPPNISVLNVALCRTIMRQLGITTEIRMSSEFGIAGDKFERPLKILKAMGATEYLSGPAARPYTDQNAFRAAGIDLLFKAYDYPDYPQLHGAFEPNVSVLDLLFNCGPASRSYLKSRLPNEIPAICRPE